MILAESRVTHIGLGIEKNSLEMIRTFEIGEAFSVSTTSGSTRMFFFLQPKLMQFFDFFHLSFTPLFIERSDRSVTNLIRFTLSAM